MVAVISPNNRVLATRYVNGYTRNPYRSIVIEWTAGGKLKVKADGSGKVILVSSEDVKKVADGGRA